MRKFLWSMVFTSLLMVLWAEVATPIVLHKNRGKDTTEHTLPFHKTLYAARNLTQEQLGHLVVAVGNWYDATNGQVIFDIATLPAEHIDVQKSIIVFNVTEDNPIIISLDSVNKNSTLGYCDETAWLPYIMLVESRIDDDEWAGVIQHELGHELGLNHPDSKEHPEIGLGSLMYSNITLGSTTITNTDLIQFCQMYHCEAEKLHGFTKVQ